MNKIGRLPAVSKSRLNNSLFVLVADNNREFNLLTQKALRSRGYNTESASSGTSVINMLANKRYDFLLLDQSFSDLTGKEVLNSLSQKDLYVPPVIITGKGPYRPDNQMIRFGVQGHVTKNSGGVKAILRKIDTIMDDSRRKSLTTHEQTLAESERRFKYLSENTLEWTWEIAPDGRYTYSSPIVERFLGYRPGELVNKYFYDFFHSEDREDLKEALFDIFAMKKSFREFISRSLHKNGKTMWSLSSGNPVLDNRKNLIGYRGITTDITNLKRTEEALQHALEESKLRQVEMSALLAGARAVIEKQDFKDATYAIIEYCKNLVGAAVGFISLLSRDSHINKVLYLESDTLYPAFSHKFSKPFNVMAREVYRTGRSIFNNDMPKNRALSKTDGRYIHMNNVLIAPLRIKKIVQGLLVMVNKPDVFTDNDARLSSAFGELAAIALNNSRTLESLENSEEHFRSVVETASDAIVTTDYKGHIVFWNNTAKSMFGYSESEALGNPLTFIISEQYKKTYTAAVKKLSSTDSANKTASSIEIFVRKKDGREFPVEISHSCWKTREQFFYTTILRDITERMRASEALHISEEKFSKAFRSSPTFITISTLTTGLILDVNDSFLSASGYQREEIIGHTEEELGTWVNPVLRSNIISLVHKEGHVYNEEVEFRTKSGTILTVLWSAELIRIQGEMCILAVILDITENRKLERQLIQAQKMEAVGRLAGGIAHDFNNILSAIMNYAYISKKNAHESEKPFDTIEQIIALSEKGSDITQGLLAFSRDHFINPVPLSLNDTVRCVEKLLAKFIGEDIQLNIRCSRTHPVILADRAQVEQVLMNLATNARDAMPDGGSLTIKTGTVKIDSSFIQTNGFGEKGTYALLTVTDTGSGMDENTRQKVFEPFFTTKEVGKGTGLGLAIIYGIVKQHDGYIIVNSKPGQGTTVKIYFKTTSEAVKKKQRVYAKVPAGRSETILIAEDEPAVRHSMKNILEEFGYTVIEAADGEEAVSSYKKHKKDIKLLVFDVIMPKKSGTKAYDEIRVLNPGIKAIFTTGYAGTHIDKKTAHKGLDVISKPVLPGVFLKKIREVLHGNQAKQ